MDRRVLVHIWPAKKDVCGATHELTRAICTLCTAGPRQRGETMTDYNTRRIHSLQAHQTHACTHKRSTMHMSPAPAIQCDHAIGCIDMRNHVTWTRRHRSLVLAGAHNPRHRGGFLVEWSEGEPEHVCDRHHPNRSPVLVARHNPHPAI